MSVSDEVCLYDRDTTLGSAAVTAGWAQQIGLLLPHAQGCLHVSFAPIPVNQGLLALLVLIVVIEIEIHSANTRRKIKFSPVSTFLEPLFPLTPFPQNGLWFATMARLRLLPGSPSDSSCERDGENATGIPQN